MRLQMGLTMSLTCGKVGEVGMSKIPMYRDPPTFRDYEDFRIGIAYTRGWNDAMNAIFPEEAERRRNEEMKKNLRVVPKE